MLTSYVVVSLEYCAHLLSKETMTACFCKLKGIEVPKEEKKRQGKLSRGASDIEQMMLSMMMHDHDDDDHSRTLDTVPESYEGSRRPSRLKFH